MFHLENNLQDQNISNPRMNVKEKHTVYNRLKRVNASPNQTSSKTLSNNRNFTKNVSNSSVITSEVIDVDSLADDKYYKRTSLFYCSSEEDEKEESLFDTIFEQQCSKSMSRKSLSVNLKERKFFKRNVSGSSTSKSIVPPRELEIDDVSKILKMISKSDTFLNCNSSTKTPIKTYCRTKKSKENRDVIETFALPDIPILPDIPLTHNLLDAEVVDASEITFCKDFEEPWIAADFERNEVVVNKSYTWKNKKILTSTPLSKVTVNAVTKPKSSGQSLMDKMRDNIKKILNETKSPNDNEKIAAPKIRKKLSMQSNVEISYNENKDQSLGNRKIEISVPLQTYSNRCKTDISPSKLDLEDASSKTYKTKVKSKPTIINLETSTDSQRKLRSSHKFENNSFEKSESKECIFRRGRSLVKKSSEKLELEPKVRSRSSEVLERLSEEHVLSDKYKSKLRSKSQGPICSFRKLRQRELKIILNPLKKSVLSKMFAEEVEDTVTKIKSNFPHTSQPEISQGNINITKILSDWDYRDADDIRDIEQATDVGNTISSKRNTKKNTGTYTMKSSDFHDKEFEIIAQKMFQPNLDVNKQIDLTSVKNVSSEDVLINKIERDQLSSTRENNLLMFDTNKFVSTENINNLKISLKNNGELQGNPTEEKILDDDINKAIGREFERAIKIKEMYTNSKSAQSENIIFKNDKLEHKTIATSTNKTSPEELKLLRKNIKKSVTKELQGRINKTEEGAININKNTNINDAEEVISLQTSASTEIETFQFPGQSLMDVSMNQKHNWQFNKDQFGHRGNEHLKKNDCFNNSSKNEFRQKNNIISIKKGLCTTEMEFFPDEVVETKLNESEQRKRTLRNRQNDKNNRDKIEVIEKEFPIITQKPFSKKEQQSFAINEENVQNTNAVTTNSDILQNGQIDLVETDMSKALLQKSPENNLVEQTKNIFVTEDQTISRKEATNNYKDQGNQTGINKDTIINRQENKIQTEENDNKGSLETIEPVQSTVKKKEKPFKSKISKDISDVQKEVQKIVTGEIITNKLTDTYLLTVQVPDVQRDKTDISDVLKNSKQIGKPSKIRPLVVDDIETSSSSEVKLNEIAVDVLKSPKKRGRPKKIECLKEAIANLSNLEQVNIIESVEKPIKNEQKNRSNVIDHDTYKTKEDNETTPNTNLIVSPRRRGRPPKIKPLIHETYIAHSETLENKSTEKQNDLCSTTILTPEEVQAISEVKSPRKRGRPKINLNKDIVKKVSNKKTDMLDINIQSTQDIAQVIDKTSGAISSIFMSPRRKGRLSIVQCSKEVNDVKDMDRQQRNQINKNVNKQQYTNAGNSAEKLLSAVLNINTSPKRTEKKENSIGVNLMEVIKNMEETDNIDHSKLDNRINKKKSITPKKYSKSQCIETLESSISINEYGAQIQNNLLDGIENALNSVKDGANKSISSGKGLEEIKFGECMSNITSHKSTINQNRMKSENEIRSTTTESEVLSYENLHVSEPTSNVKEPSSNEQQTPKSSFADELDIAKIEADVADVSQEKDIVISNDAMDQVIIPKLTRSKSRLALMQSDGDNLPDNLIHRELFRSKSSLGLSRNQDSKKFGKKNSIDSKDVGKEPIERSKSVVPEWVLWKKVRVRDFQSEMKGKKAQLLTYKVGSLIWAQFSHYPFWPCIITRDTENKQCRKIVIRKMSPIIYCHVTFFGDNAKTAWIVESKIMFYKSKDDLTKKYNTEKSEGKINTELQAYIVKDRYLKKWENAVAEAEFVKDKSLQEKLNLIKQTVNKTKAILNGNRLSNEIATDGLNKRKRQLSPKKMNQLNLEEDLPFPKKLKRDNVSKLDRSLEKDVNLSKENAERAESSQKKSKKENTETPKSRKSKIVHDTSTLLSKDNISPKKDTKVVTKEGTTPKTPKKEPEPTIEPPYVPILDNENILPSRLRIRKVEEITESPPKTSPEKPKEALYTDEAQKALFRRNNLFKGVSKDKVCHYCFMLGDIYKCKGGCNGLYHLTCATEVMINKPIHLRGKKKRSLSPGIHDIQLDNTFNQEKIKLENEIKIEEMEEKDKSSDKLSTDEHVQIITVTSNIYNTPPRKTFPEHFRDMSLADRIDFKMKEVMEKFETRTVYIEGTADPSSYENSIMKQSSQPESSNKNVTMLEVSSPMPVLSDVVKSIEETVKLRHEAKIKHKATIEIQEPAVKPLKTSKGKLKFPIVRHVTADSDGSYENVLSSNKSLVKHVTADGESFEFNSFTKKKHASIDSDSFEHTPSESSSSIISQKDRMNSKHFKCGFCLTNTSPYCFICNSALSKKGSEIRQKCSLYQCGRFYHPECLKLWPQTQWSIIQTTKHKLSQEEMDNFVCPQHVCHTCASDDPRAAISRLSSDKIVKCLRCPSSYHSRSFCVPAGTEILSATQIVCPRHRNKPYTINTTWCFLCNEGGNLICCETCPTSVHPECMPVNLTEDDKFICEDCESGRLPLYDEIVWVKLGKYKWWPALILFPNEVPLNVRNIKHSAGEFVVRFFGTYDYYWVNRGRSFLFQEGDNGQTNGKEDTTFLKAIDEAVVAHKAKKEFKRTREAETINTLKPPPYIRIKVNKPVGNVKLLDLDLSNTTPCDCNPNQPNPCGPDSSCLNRLLLTECNPEICPAGSKCQNQSFEKREYPPMTPYKTQERGWGLKALASITKGQFVIEYVGELIDEAEYQRRIQKMHEQKEENYYFLTIDKDRMIDAGPKGNMARFMNHCCLPNCETQKWTVNGDTRVGLFATVDIPAGTELTFNYNLECIGKEKKVCRCGASNCSGFIGVKSKQDNEAKKSKKVIKKKKLIEHTTLPPCFVCKQEHDVALCNNKMCNKAFHLKCLDISEWPESNKFVCPWHNCNICSKRTIRCCVKCINSFCPSHSEGNVRYDNLLGFVCNKHDPTKPLYHESPVRISKQRDDIVTDESAVTSTTSDDSELEDVPLLERFARRKSKSQLQDSMEEESESTSQDENEVSSANFSNIDKVSKRKKTIRKEETVSKKFKLVESAESQSTTATSDVITSENQLNQS